jgi:membrane fusion protein, multidrug efflux system
MRKAWWIGGAAVLAFVAVGAAVAVHKQSKKGDDKPAEVALEFTPREVVAPAMAALSSRIEFSGPLVAPRTATVRAKAGGTLLTLAVNEGGRVKAGDVLATIDGTEMAARMNERLALVESARAAAVQAERTHANNQRLADQQFISATALDQSRAALDSARAQERAARAQMDTVRALSRDTRIAAPIDGIVAKRHAVAGEKVAAEQSIVTIVDLRTLELAGSVGTHEVSQLAAGAAVQVKVEGVEPPVVGTIARIAPAAEAGTRSIGVTIALPNDEELLRAGQYALATVEFADTRQRLTVPAAAIVSADGQDHVWLIDNGVLVRRAVSVGRRDARESRVEVLGGVTLQSQVLAARFDNLREGAKASVVAAKAAAGAASASLLK